MAEENQVQQVQQEPQQVTTKEPQQVQQVTNKRTTTSNYERSKES